MIDMEITDGGTLAIALCGATIMALAIVIFAIYAYKDISNWYNKKKEPQYISLTDIVDKRSEHVNVIKQYLIDIGFKKISNTEFVYAYNQVRLVLNFNEGSIRITKNNFSYIGTVLIDGNSIKDDLAELDKTLTNCIKSAVC